MPSGNDSQAAHDVFNNLYSHYLAGIPIDRTEILWAGPVYIALYGIMMIVFFFMLSTYLRHVDAPDNKLLELTSFGGHLTERVGKLAPFSFIVWGAVTTWAAYFAIKQMLFGLIY